MTKPLPKAAQEMARQRAMLSPSEICLRYGEQNCQWCNRSDCGDNTSDAKAKLCKAEAELATEREARQAAEERADLLRATVYHWRADAITLAQRLESITAERDAALARADWLATAIERSPSSARAAQSARREATNYRTWRKAIKETWHG